GGGGCHRWGGRGRRGGGRRGGARRRRRETYLHLERPDVAARALRPRHIPLVGGRRRAVAGAHRVNRRATGQERVREIVPGRADGRVRRVRLQWPEQGGRVNDVARHGSAPTR